MTSLRLFAATAAVATALSAVALADDAKLGALHIEDAWARPSIGKKGNSAAYMTIRNKGEADRLVAAAVPQAGKVELHTHIRDGDVMRMRRVEGGIPVPANGMVMLKPGGFHVMMMRLSAPIEKGGTVPVTLRFEKAGEVTVQAEVRMKPGARGHGHKGMKHK